MSLAAGTRLGGYEIVCAIGAGGMGEVYRARDTKLDRDVALKILPDLFAADPERLARFEREAKTLAALNHPHIAQIYGFEQSATTSALVMELVDGEDLAERIARGAIPVDEALAIARQIAVALEAAHEQGIVHRDLKPANVKLRPDGTIKVLDFGLAKAIEAPGGGAPSSISMSPTLTAGTQVGVILGTAAYMAPEQARGKVVDKRADIWAFGCVLYEMLTGRRAFAGEEISETLAHVLMKEVDGSALPADTPPQIRRLIERCLRKDPRTRLRDIGEARILVDEPIDEAARTTAAVPEKRRGGRLAWAITSTFALAFAVAAAVAWRATRPDPLQPLMRLSVDIGAEISWFAISPDGTRLALELKTASGRQLGTRLLRESTVTPLGGTEGAFTPFFSPDSRWIGFWADGKLKKVSVDGGAPITLCNAPAGRGAAWGDDGYIVAALSSSSGLVRIPSAGGTPEPLTQLREGERTHRWPHVLPGSRAVLFTAGIGAGAGTFDDASIEMVQLPGGERKTVQRGGFAARYLPSGHLVYAHRSTVMAAQFDRVRLEVTGTPVAVIQDAASEGFTGQFAVSDTGTFLYVTGRGMEAQGWRIHWLESSGPPKPLHDTPGRYFTPSLSPDGTRLALTVQDIGEDIWVKDLERGTMSRLSFLRGENREPLWTPDGEGIVFQSLDPDSRGVYWVAADGSGEAVRLTEDAVPAYPNSFSPDGKRLVLSRTGSGGSFDLFTAAIEHDGTRLRLGKPEFFVGTRFDEGWARFSPDGRWIAYASNESGRYEVYVRPFRGAGARSQISTAGGLRSRWSLTARELIFQSLDGKLMTVPYAVVGDRFRPGQPRVWSQARLLGAASRAWDLAPDGKRIVALAGAEQDRQPITHVTMLLNFFDEVRRRLGPGE